MTFAGSIRRRTVGRDERASGPVRLLLAGALVIMTAIAASLVLGIGPAGAQSVVVGEPVVRGISVWPFVVVASAVAAGGVVAVVRSRRHADR